MKKKRTFNGNTTFGRDFVGRHLGFGWQPVPRRVEHVALLSHLPMLGWVQVQQILFGRLREHVAHTAPVQLGIIEHVAVGTIRFLYRLCIATLIKKTQLQIRKKWIIHQYSATTLKKTAEKLWFLKLKVWRIIFAKVDSFTQFCQSS